MPILKRLWGGWKRAAHRIARFNSLVLTTILYYLFLPLVAVPFRLTKDPLRLREGSGFRPRPAGEASLQDAGRQG